MIAVETNILVYAHRRDMPLHGDAHARLAELAEGAGPWAVPWPCVAEFVAIVTNARLFVKPSPLPTALDQVEAWLASPSLVLLSEGDEFWGSFRTVLESGRVAGGQVHDGRIAAICIANGVQELWTADRDFGRFAGLRTRNPLVGR
ncbi:MAG TPA: TA system VapC family ribonuclease toxin [Myxococcales bacterium]|nr:TA system VapC family ribonuclease toxin [Myxococcales bacterium]